MRRLAVLAAVATLALNPGGLMAQVPDSVTLPAGTKIKAELRSTLDSAHARVGERVHAVTTSDVKVHGQKLLPRGSKLLGSITAVTPAESAQSPSHLAVVFTEARTKTGQVVSLDAAITGVQRLTPRQPMMDQPAMPAMESPERPGMNSNGRENATLGTEPIPPQITGANQNMDAMVRSHPAPLGIKMEPDKGSVLTSRGNFKLDAGTRLELRELQSKAGAQAGAGSR